MGAKALDLFQAYAEGALPRDGGYIVSSFFDTNSSYSIYEVVAYAAVKNIYLTEEGLTFQTDGNKLFILVEPASYPQKFMEPFRRENKYKIPHRFNELETIIAKNQDRIMVSKEPIISYGSFTILKPTGMNFSLCFYKLEDVFDSISYFFETTLHKEANIPTPDAKKSAKTVIAGVKKFGLW
ncbi:MAG: hypothetical protein JW874_16200 [Spirochaetales bacterium]|nr:hypothetical protein [Spirochaetales bacterium]